MEHYTEMCSGSEAGSYLRLIDLCTGRGLTGGWSGSVRGGRQLRVSPPPPRPCLELRITPCTCQNRKVAVRLPGKGNSNSHDARPVHRIITMIKWFRNSRLSIKNSLSTCRNIGKVGAHLARLVTTIIVVASSSLLFSSLELSDTHSQ